MSNLADVTSLAFLDFYEGSLRFGAGNCRMSSEINCGTRIASVLHISGGNKSVREKSMSDERRAADY